MPNSILHILENKVLPLVLRDGLQRFVVAQPQLQQMRQYQHISFKSKPQQGPRKGMRTYTFSNVSAIWPRDFLLETRAPMLTFVLQGQADLNCGDYVMKLPEDYGVLVPGDVPRWSGNTDIYHLGDDAQRFSHTIHFVENSGSLHVWMANQQGNEHTTDNVSRLLVHNSSLLRLLEEMQREFEKKRRRNEEIARRLLELFLLSLIRDLHEERCVYSFAQVSEDSFPGQTYNSIVEAQKYIQRHLHEHLTQDKVASVVRLSRTQFIRCFREETGQTFNQFVTNCRLDRAKVLLRTTNFPLTFVYQSLGYKSSSHFNALFCKATGMLPREFRHNETLAKNSPENATENDAA